MKSSKVFSKSGDLIREFPEFPTKAKGIAFLKSKGYTELVETTESGDHGYGSRLYYKNPETGRVASVSKVGKPWFVSEF